MTTTIALLLTTTTTAVPPEQGLSWVVTAAFMVGLMYLLIWRPEQKRRKAIETLRSQIKVGERVIAMGIIGTVYSIKEESVILKMYDGSRIEVLKAAISDIDRTTVAEKTGAELAVTGKSVSSKDNKEIPTTANV